MSLHHLGATRSRRALDHLLQTPDTFVWSPLPGLENGSACVHVSPALGAGFAQYTLAVEVGGTWQSDPAHSRFLYVLEGSVSVHTDGEKTCLAGEFCYAPAGTSLQLGAAETARVAVIEKPWQPLQGSAGPRPVDGAERDVAASPLLGDATIQVRSLLPPDLAFDMAVNTMTYQPGARLGMVEVHVMEHGLLMLEGEGIYRLGDAWYPVAAGDFIWMAPYCPQWFGALGSVPAKYLIYKDWNRPPFAA